MSVVKIVAQANNSNSVNVDYKSTSKKAYTAPKILESFIDDNGEIMHILENGNTQSDSLYTKMWGLPKGAIKPKTYKGYGLDSRSNWIKP